MTTRTRSSPKNKSAELDESAKTESSANLSAPKQNLLKLRLLYLAFIAGFGLLIMAGFQFGYMAGQNTSKKPNSVKENTNGKKDSVPEKLELKIHWAGSPNQLTKKYDQDTDVCYILQHCFNGSIFEPDHKTNPDDPFKACHKAVENMLRSNDSGFMFEGKKVVGFASIKYLETPSRTEMRIYNVCVRKDDRGKGVARQMIPQLVKAIKEKRVTDHDKRLYAGLSVDFETDSSALAFSTYAKLGFIRWWQPCNGAFEINFDEVESQEDSETARLAMNDFVLKRRETMKKLFVPNQVGLIPKQLCMVMKVGSDEFSTIGTELKNYIKAALLGAKQ